MGVESVRKADKQSEPATSQSSRQTYRQTNEHARSFCFLFFSEKRVKELLFDTKCYAARQEHKEYF